MISSALLPAALGGIAFLLASTSALLGAAPRLSLPTVSGSTATLRLLGDPGVAYRFEASTNLASWVEIGSGVAQDGTLSVQHAGPTTSRWTYYRAVQTGSGGGPSFPTVVAVVSTNAFATAVVVPDQETILQFQDDRQVLYTLTLPVRSVSEPTMIRISALEEVTGLPNAAGLLAGARLEPAGFVPLAPGFLQMDFPTAIAGTNLASFAFDNDGARLHLVPDVVVAKAGTNRVRILVNQWRSHGAGLFTRAELAAQAATVPPPRRPPSNAALQDDLAGCYPEDQEAAREMQKELEDRIRPRQQAAAATLGQERQNQLLGVSDEAEGTAALRRVLADSEAFYETELRSRLAQAKGSCAVAQTLAPWALGFERQRSLLGGGDPVSGASVSSELLCAGSRRCQEQATECCRTKGGDTRLVQTLLGIERQRALLGAGAECGEISVDEVLRDCAPNWYGTLSITISGRYLNLETNGNWHIRRTSRSDYVLSANVFSAKVRAHEASFFSPAYTNLSLVLGGPLVASDHMEKVEENRELSCQGKPLDLRRDTWDSSANEQLTDIDLEAVIMAPDASSLFVKPYLQISDNGAVRDMLWFYEELHTERSEFADEACVTTPGRTGGNYDPKAGNYGVMVNAGPEEFTWTADTIRYTYNGSEPMRFDFEHLFDGVRKVDLELHRVR